MTAIVEQRIDEGERFVMRVSLFKTASGVTAAKIAWHSNPLRDVICLENTPVEIVIKALYGGITNIEISRPTEETP